MDKYKGVKPVKKDRKNIKLIAISAAALIAAVLFFLYTYYNLIPGIAKNAVVYTLRASVAAGVETLSGLDAPLSLELRPDGRCFLTNANGSLHGRWSLDDERIQVKCGKLMLYGTKSENELRLHEINGRAVELLLTTEESAKAYEIPAGEWKLVSVTVGEDIYEKNSLKASGYDISKLTISGDGSGKAVFADGIEKPLIVYEDAIEYEGRLLACSCTDTEIYLQYADGVLFVFEKSEK